MDRSRQVRWPPPEGGSTPDESQRYGPSRLVVAGPIIRERREEEQEEARLMNLKNLGVLVSAVVLFTVAACGGGGGGVAAACSAVTPSAGATGTAIKVGVELPMTGGEAPNGVPTAAGVALALTKNSVPGFTITCLQEDDAVNGKHNANQGAANMQTLVNDPQVQFVVGAYNSSVSQAEIPVSNAAGLMQCSPANTAVELTKPWGAAKPEDLRPTHPDKIAYVRLAATDDIQGAAGADIAYTIAGKKTVYLADDTQTYGKGIADAFATAYMKLGGTILKRDGIPATTTDFTSYITALKGLNPEYVYYGGVTTSGIGIFRKQMASQGLQTIPFGGGDGIVDGAAATASSFLNIAGSDGAANTYGTVAAIHDIPNAAQFAADYKAKFSTDPGSYSAPAYACVQVFLQALKEVGTGVTDLAQLREKIRAYVADASHSYDTVLGTFTLDANGDTSQHVISYYQYDTTTKDWKFLQQRDFTANPL
jgi:branched-chain amino acid transport system substrate-binding protein